MQRKSLVIATMALAIGVPAAAQSTGGGQMEGHPTTVARFYNVTAKEGHASQLEEGIKKHIAWHRGAGDKGGWHVWNVATGPGMGGYVVGTLGRTWEGLEQTEMGAEDEADVAITIAPHVENVTGSIWVYRGDISPAAEGGSPATFAQVIHYYLRPEGVPVFEGVIRQISQSMMKLPAEQRAPSPPMIYELMAGGQAPRMALVFNRDGWGDFAPSGVTPLQALEKAFGQEKAREIMKTGAQGIRYTETEILRYRADLSSPAAASND